MTNKSESLKYVNSLIGIQDDEDGIFKVTRDINNAKNRTTAPKDTKFLPNTRYLVVEPLNNCVWRSGQWGMYQLA
ncbi:hypothetical protein BU096_02275 [Staphylococcus xylosus]|uniref:hypothetical protein n=1 Tax=Staphylococcus xylosus TaxID=1288 RepID=UPI000D1D7340|nr:hypothetical protein [Staphylococcus xylosus]PTI10201.1 hypothetical protein BU096_02275 [Staphylococcus xylosus]